MRVFNEKLDLVDPFLNIPGQYGIDQGHGKVAVALVSPKIQ
jgi:hypothetical protein